MSEHRIDSSAPSPTSPASGFSKAAKLAHAAAFAALLVPLSSVPSEASTISCGFGGAGFDSNGAPTDTYDISQGGSQCNPSLFPVPGGEGFGPNQSQYVFGFGQYALTLEFDTVLGPFHIDVENEEISQTALAASGRLAAFPGSVCVPIANGLTTCVVFHFTGDTTPNGPNDSGDDTWSGNWTAFINWLGNTNAGYPGSSMLVIHARGDDNTGNGQQVFDTDITFGSFCAGPPTTDPCPHSPPGFPDPEIAGNDDNFQSITNISTNAVPEPASLVLLGSGITALLYRRRRKVGLTRASGKHGTPIA